MKRVPMRKIRDALRLRTQGLSNREIALSLGMARSTIGEYLHRADVASLSWPLPEDMTDTALEEALYPIGSLKPGQKLPQPNWAEIHSQLRAKGVTGRPVQTSIGFIQ